MNKLRQSLRRRKPAYVPEASRPHQWQADEDAVRKGTCSFPVRVSGRGAGRGCVYAVLGSRGPGVPGCWVMWLRPWPKCERRRIPKEPHSLGPSKLGLKPNTHSLVPGRYYLGSQGTFFVESPHPLGAHN